MGVDLGLQVAESVFEKMDADLSLEALVGKRIFDGTPDKEPFPLVNFAPLDSDTNRFKEGIGQSHDYQIDSWSRERGQTEVRQIMAAIHNIFETETTGEFAGDPTTFAGDTQILAGAGARNPGNYSRLAVVDGTVSHCQIGSHRVIYERDNKTYHGVTTLNIRTRSD